MFPLRLILCKPASGYRITKDGSECAEELKKLHSVSDAAGLFGMTKGEAASKIAKILARRIGEADDTVKRCDGIVKGIGKGTFTVAFVTAHEDVCITFSKNDTETPMFKKAVSLLTDLRSCGQKELDDATSALNTAFR